MRKHLTLKVLVRNKRMNALTETPAKCNTLICGHRTHGETVILKMENKEMAERSFSKRELQRDHPLIL